MSESALECNVLVLNRFYMAIRVINVRRAMTLMYRGCAEVITIDAGVYTSYEFDAWCEISQLHSLEKQPDEDYIRAVHFEMQVPRVLRLTRYDRLPKCTVRSIGKTCSRATIIAANIVAKCARTANLVSITFCRVHSAANDLGKYCMQLHAVQFA